MKVLGLHKWLAAALALGAAAGCSLDRSGSAVRGGGDSDGGGSGADARVGGPDAAAFDAAATDAGTVTLDATICPYTAVAPLLDSNPVGPWLAADFITFRASDAELKADLQAQYGWDASVDFACLHDDASLYFFFKVTDDHIVSNSVSLRQDDGIVLFLDGNGDRDGTYGDDDHALMLGANADTFDYGPGDLTPSGSESDTASGYDIEIGLDLASVGPIPADGVIGFNLAIIDDDDLGNSDRDVFALRYVPAPPACDACCDGQAQPWCDTTVTGTLTLAAQ
jgi:hypothetical protein